MAEIVINSRNFRQFINPVVAGEQKVCGTLPRDFSKEPHGSMWFAPAFDLPLIPENEWQKRLDAQKAAKAQLSDIRNIGMGGQPIPSRDQNSYGYCFPAGTYIRMADGSEKRIEDVKICDRVVTAEGRTGRVTQTMVRSVNEPLYRLIMWGHSHLKATAEHPILTQRGYVPIKEVKEGDFVAFPKYAVSEPSRIIQTGDLLYEKNFVRQSRHTYRERPKQQIKERVFGLPGRTQTVIRTNILPDAIRLSYGFGRLVGLYLAEGFSGSARIVLAFHAKERDSLVAEVEKIFKDELGVVSTIVVRGNSAKLTVYSKEWSKFFTALCGYGAGHKLLHSLVSSGPPEFLEGVLTGWMDGDRKGARSAVSISRALALGMFDIANEQDRMPILSIHTKGGTGKDSSIRQDSWLMGLNDSESYRSSQDETHMWKAVRGVEAVDFQGDVFNLEVEGDHSYVAEGVGVHNCWCHSGVSAHLICRALMNEPYADLSAFAIGAMVKNWRNEGGWGSEGIEFQASRGCPTSQFWPQKSMDRVNDNPKTWENAAKHKYVTWRDLDPNNMKAQLVTSLLLGRPVVVDYAWWSHSVCAIDLVNLNPFQIRIWNSWSDSWSERGTGLLEGNKAIPESAWVALVTTPSSEVVA